MTITKTTSAIVVALFCWIAPALADEETPDNEHGRYSFSKVAEGLLRLDMQTGEVSVCSQRAVGWACQAAPEDRAVLENEIARLRTENAALKKDILAHGLPLPGRRHAGAAGGARRRPRPAAWRQFRSRPHGGDRRPLVASLRRRHRAGAEASAEQQELKLTCVSTGRPSRQRASRPSRPQRWRWRRPARASSRSPAKPLRFLDQVKARDGALTLFIRHTSASLVIQENADPDVRTDLVTALSRLAPADAGWVHDVEGPDDMPAHVKSMLNGVSLHVPVNGGRMMLGTWQGIYVAEHRSRPHRREVVLQFMGSCAEDETKFRDVSRTRPARRREHGDLGSFRSARRRKDPVGGDTESGSLRANDR